MGHPVGGAVEELGGVQPLVSRVGEVSLGHAHIREVHSGRLPHDWSLYHGRI